MLTLQGYGSDAGDGHDRTGDVINPQKAFPAACSGGPVNSIETPSAPQPPDKATTQVMPEKPAPIEAQVIVTPEQYIESQKIIDGYRYAGDSGMFVSVGEYIFTAYGDTWVQKAENLNNGEVDITKHHEMINNNFILTKPDGTVSSMFQPDSFDSVPVAVPAEKMIDGENKRNFYWPKGMLVRGNTVYVAMQ